MSVLLKIARAVLAIVLVYCALWWCAELLPHMHALRFGEFYVLVPPLCTVACALLLLSWATTTGETDDVD